MRNRNEGGQVLPIVAGLVAAIMAITAVTLIGWNVGWWFKTQNANREAHVIRGGYSNQQTLRDEITKKLGDVQTISTQVAELGTSDPATKRTLTAQRVAVVNIVCHDAEQVTGDPLPADQVQFIGANCALGSISPSSQYNVTG